jgi:hypothetical protein
VATQDSGRIPPEGIARQLAGGRNGERHPTELIGGPVSPRGAAGRGSSGWSGTELPNKREGNWPMGEAPRDREPHPAKVVPRPLVRPQTEREVSTVSEWKPLTDSQYKRIRKKWKRQERTGSDRAAREAFRATQGAGEEAPGTRARASDPGNATIRQPGSEGVGVVADTKGSQPAMPRVRQHGLCRLLPRRPYVHVPGLP